MAYTSKAKTKQLQAALSTNWKAQLPSKPKHSILRHTEKKKLFQLSQIIKRMHRQPTTSSQKERTRVYKAIVKPATALGLSVGYVLDVISTYADHQCHPRKRKYTIVSMAHPHLPLILHSAHSVSKRKLRDELEEHTRLVSRIHPNDVVKRVLGAALEKYQAECRFKSVKIVSGYHTREGFSELARDLAGKERTLVKWRR